jgi:hypothetical protein
MRIISLLKRNVHTDVFVLICGFVLDFLGLTPLYSEETDGKLIYTVGFVLDKNNVLMCPTKQFCWTVSLGVEGKAPVPQLSSPASAPGRRPSGQGALCNAFPLHRMQPLHLLHLLQLLHLHLLHLLE